METNKLIGHLASVLGDSFNLTLSDVEEADSEADKEVIYGLICLHDDLAFYKKKSELLLDNFKNTLFSSAAITITNSKGVIKNVNELMVKLSLYAKDELIGSRHDILDAKEDQNEDYQLLIPHIAASKTWRGEVKSIKKNGSIFWLDTHIFPIKNTEGITYEYWTVSTDITKRKNVEQEIIKKNKDLEQFSYVISHDLKTPAIQINQLTNFILEDHGSSFNEDCAKMFNVLSSRAEHLNKLIDGILTYSRADFNNSSVEEIDLTNLIRELIVINVIPKHIEVHIANDLPVIIGNRTKVEQIFENLISNGVKYMDKKKGLLELKVDKTKPNFFKFEFSDNGAGIGNKHLDSIFEMFVTAHGQNRADSTGIGLAVIKKIINSYGGEIGCNSVLGEGTTFWFTWPKP